MRPFRYSVTRMIDAPADVVYHCIADYREHHRPGGFLPPAFTDLEVLEGGVGAGTVIRFTTSVGGRTITRTHKVTEPVPGRVLVESGDDEGSTFTLEPHGGQTLVRIDTVLPRRGIEGLLLPVFGPRILRPLYLDELERLERHAQQQVGETVSRP